MGMNYIVQCCLYNFRKWVSSPKIYVTYAFLVLFLYGRMMSMRELCVDTGISVTPWLLTFLFTSGNEFTYLMIWFMVSFFMSNAPFEDNQKTFLISRVGKRNWCLGQLSYIVLSSFVLVVSTWLVQLLYVFPYISLELSWGKVLNTLAQTDLSESYQTINIQYSILLDNEPLPAFLWSFLLFWLISVFLGVLSYCLNLLIHKFAGITACGILAFTCVFLYSLEAWTQKTFFYLVPTCWANLSFMKTFDSGQYPGRILAVIMLLILIVVLGTASVRLSYKKG